ncbi:hypothetical protein GQ54DRAFT_273081 [Martensiomyces pterosporus]|nr:hypothetical protein GQ54DRAFT_273081 [Martensiomyces pterosporus]
MLFKINAYVAAVTILSALLSSATAQDYFPDKVEVKYGAGFQITYQDNAKYIYNKVSQETYVLYQSGTDIPAGITPTPANSLQVGNWTKVFAVPGNKVVLDSAPASAIVELLNAQSTVGGAYKYFEVTSPCMQKLLGGVTRIQQSWNIPSARRKRNTFARRVYYDLGNNGLDWTFTTYGMSDPRSVAVNPESATDLLGKAEWIKFVAAFYNKEAEANQIFSAIESRYNDLKSSVSQPAKKTVGFARYNKVANGTVVSWTVDQAQPWFAQGLADAGLNVYTGDVTGYSNINDFYKVIANWDILIDLSIEPLPHGGATIPEWSNIYSGYQFDASNNANAAKSFNFLTNNAIYRTDRISGYNNATDYNEHYQVQPDLLLTDFIKIASSAGAQDALWHRNLPKQVPVDWKSASECQN